MHNTVPKYNQFNHQINQNGVKIRYDGKGDGWANAHREELPRDNYMQDIDCFFGINVAGHNTGDKLFLEYIPDNYDKNRKSVEDFCIVALFDRKFSEEYAFSNKNYTSRKFYLYICNQLSKNQPVPCKFFYVIGNKNPPWKMIELSLDEGHKIREKYVDSGDWNEIWKELGLVSIKDELVKWLKSKH